MLMRRFSPAISWTFCPRLPEVRPVLHAIIVAGGRSSRMRASAPVGTPAKPLLEFLSDATPLRLIDHCIGSARDVLPEGGRCVVVGPAMDLPADVERVREEPVWSGPASAIATGVRQLEGDGACKHGARVLILAADVVNPAPAIAALLEAASENPGAQAWVAETDGHPQPLLSLVDAQAAATAFAGVRGGSIRAVFATLDVCPVPLSAEVSRDVDTWEQAQAAGIGMRPGPAEWTSARDRVAAVAERIYRDRTARAIPMAPGVGRVVASDIESPMNVPHYTSSAMDGYAVAGPGPWELLAEPAEGAQGHNIHRTGGTLREGQALPVLTGSLLPEGADAVVRSEHSEVRGGELRLLDGITVRTGADIRHAGEELHAGEVLVTQGTLLQPRHLALLGACGVDSVPVLPALTVDLAFSGNEVITSGIPGPGEVRDAFSGSFPALVEQLGGTVRSVTRLRDDPEQVEGWLESAEADIVVITGGSGHSGQDFARRFITETADVVLAESVRCAPGHPTLLAARERGSRIQLIIGAPGNPLAAHVALHSFLEPGLAVANGGEFPATVPYVVGETIPAITKQRTRLIPARVVKNTERQCTAIPMTRTNSHMLSGYAHADALLVVPATGAPEGAVVPGLPLG